MKIIGLSIILLSSIFLFCPSGCANAEEEPNCTDSQKEKSLFDEIRELAARMEVFPMDIYAQNYD